MGATTAFVPESQVTSVQNLVELLNAFKSLWGTHIFISIYQDLYWHLTRNLLSENKCEFRPDNQAWGMCPRMNRGLNTMSMKNDEVRLHNHEK